jgi:phosphoribosyl 1,2-cyclic phosphodiesterase
LKLETVRNRLLFLGTAGARYVAFGFLRHAGGIYLSLDGFNIHIDPGPGAFVHAYRKGVELHKTDAVILSHRHLDHCADANHILEAITLGSKRKKGWLVCPEDALSSDPVVLEYVRRNIKTVTVVKEGTVLRFTDSLSVSFPLRHIHRVETYGMVFHWKRSLGYISDTAYFDRLLDAYSCARDLLILNVTMKSPNPAVDHLSADDAERIIGEIKPELSVITHFGRTMLSAKPWEVALAISKRTGTRVLSAYDNMLIDLDTLQVVRQR